MIDVAQWLHVLTAAGVRAPTAATWAPAFFDEVQPEKFSAGMDDILAFLPEILHECALLERLYENLNYSAQRICAVWPHRFPTEADAAPFAHNSQALANSVYGSRMGNTEPNDGWDFAGKCPIMITGKNAYLRVGNRIGQDLTVSPQLILQPHYGLDASIGWWEGDISDNMLSDQVRCRRKVQGGSLGLPDVLRLAGLVKGAFA